MLVGEHQAYGILRSSRAPCPEQPRDLPDVVVLELRELELETEGMLLVVETGVTVVVVVDEVETIVGVTTGSAVVVVDDGIVNTAEDVLDSTAESAAGAEGTPTTGRFCLRSLPNRTGAWCLPCTACEASSAKTTVLNIER